MGLDTYYDILGVSSNSSPAEIRAKHRKLIQRIHPDLDGPAALFRQVQDAYEVLSDPARRAAYDRTLESGGVARPGARAAAQSEDTTSHQSPPRQSRAGEAPPGAARPKGGFPDPRRRVTRKQLTGSFLREYPARAVAIGGAGLLALGAAVGPIGTSLLALGLVCLALAGVAGIGARGVKECEAFQRSGMAAVDSMTGRQFRSLLEHHFASRGYRVARLGAGRGFGAHLLVSGSQGRTIVQIKRWTGMVRHDAVQRAILARARYGVPRALVVTSSSYSEEAVMAANSNDVTLWNRSALAAELSAFEGETLQYGVKRFAAELQAGTRICLGMLVTVLVAVLALGTKKHRMESVKRPSA